MSIVLLNFPKMILLKTFLLFNKISCFSQFFVIRSVDVMITHKNESTENPYHQKAVSKQNFIK